MTIFLKVENDGYPNYIRYDVLYEYVLNRLHCCTSGAPILGDPVYHNDPSQAFSDSLGLQLQRLCCMEMTLPHPMTGEPLTVTTRR